MFVMAIKEGNKSSEKELTIAEAEERIKTRATETTRAQLSQIIPEEMRKTADARPPNELKTYYDIILDFIANKKRKIEASEYLNNIGAGTPTTIRILKKDGLFDIIYNAYWKNFAKKCMELATENFYLRKPEEAAVSFQVVNKNWQFIKETGISQRDLFQMAKESKYGNWMSNEEWRKFITMAVKNGFDRVTALETLARWGIVPPILLQMPQKMSQAKLIQPIQQSFAALAMLTSEEINKKLKDIKEDGKVEKTKSLLEKEYNGKAKTELGKAIAKTVEKSSEEQEKHIEKVVREMTKLIAIVAGETGRTPAEIISVLNGKTKDATKLRAQVIDLVRAPAR